MDLEEPFRGDSNHLETDWDLNRCDSEAQYPSVSNWAYRCIKICNNIDRRNFTAKTLFWWTRHNHSFRLYSYYRDLTGERDDLLYRLPEVDICAYLRRPWTNIYQSYEPLSRSLFTDCCAENGCAHTKFGLLRRVGLKVGVEKISDPLYEWVDFDPGLRKLSFRETLSTRSDVRVAYRSQCFGWSGRRSRAWRV